MEVGKISWTHMIKYIKPYSQRNYQYTYTYANGKVEKLPFIA